MCKWARSNQERRNDHYVEDIEMEGFKGFDINNIVTDLEAKKTPRTKLPREDIRETVSKMLNRNKREMMDRNPALEALTGPEGENMDNTN